jgi:hypothetical protein
LTNEIATHPNPAWREKANFLIFADLGDYGMPGRWEQLWARQEGNESFELCCIPFFTYGLALGDWVRTGSRGSKRYVVTALEARSGRIVGRLWLKEVKNPAVREAIEEFVQQQSWLSEWRSNLMALDLPGLQAWRELAAFLEMLPRDHGVLAELGSES